MKLRNRIITTVVFVMLLSLFVLLLVSVTGNIYRENFRTIENRRMVEELLPVMYQNCGGDPVHISSVLNRISFISDWRLKVGEKIVAGAGNNRDMIVGRLFNTVVLREPDEKLLFIVRSTDILHQSHVTFIVTGILFTVFLTVVLYLRLSHLVIRPVEIVIDACRSAGAGIPPGRNPMGAREDETGVMVRKLYSLFDELFEYRSKLEEKVREVSREMQKTQEELILSQRLSATGKLAAGIAHEINNPLGGMLNAVNKIKKSVSGEKELEYIELLEDCIARIEKLVKELLTFVRKQNEFVAVPVSECVDFVKRMVTHSLRDKNITFEDSIPEGLEIQGDPGQLQQMLLNLILNSIDSVEAESGRIQVSCSEKDGDIELRVSDNGMGIPEEDLDHIFDLFFSTKESGKGTGLGLGIVHTIVKQHNGTISVNSSEGEMTVIIITFPGGKE